MAGLFTLRVFARNLLRGISEDIHTYIIGHYSHSVRIIDLVSHTTYVVCVNFIYKWRALLFTVDDRLRNFSWQF